MLTIYVSALLADDNEGSDQNEGFEIAGVTGTSIDGYSVHEHEGSSRAPSATEAPRKDLHLWTLPQTLEKLKIPVYQPLRAPAASARSPNPKPPGSDI